MELPEESTTLKELGARTARHRVSLGLTQAALAEEAGVAKRTVERLEAGQSTQLGSALRIWRRLGLLEPLDRFLPDVPPSPLEALKKQKREERSARRPRAPRGKARKDTPPKPWTWGDSP